MNHKYVLLAALTVALLTLSSSRSFAWLPHAMRQAGSNNAIDSSNADVEAIERITKDFVAAYNAGDVKRVTDVYSPDVIYMYQGMANHEGREVLEQIFQGFFSQFTAQVVVHVDEIKVSGDMAFDRATFTVTATPKAGGTGMLTKGRLLEVWRKEQGGKWKAFRVMVNMDE